jgi:Holliday junction DNA helicase RuvB
VNRDSATKALEMLDIDAEGFDEMDLRIIEAIIHKFGGGPVGLNSLAVAVGEEAGTLEDVHEPYLIMQGYLSRTPQGRVAMPKAYQKLGMPTPRNKVSETQPDLLS